MASLACRAKPGDACKGGAVCDDPEGPLVCVDGRLVRATCKGPDGCNKASRTCDTRGNATGDACIDDPARPTACAPDGGALVKCVGGKVEREECDGPFRCFAKPTGTLVCDKALRAGARCSVEGDWCSSDKKDWLTCQGGKLVVAGRCRGPAGCAPLAGTVACDVSLAEEGDPCVPGSSACAADGKAVFTCRDGAMKRDGACPPDKPCGLAGARAACAPKSR